MKKLKTSILESEKINENSTDYYVDLVEANIKGLEQLIKMRLGIDVKLQVDANREYVRISSGDVTKYLGNTLVKTLFTDIKLDFWGGQVTPDKSKIWFNPMPSLLTLQTTKEIFYTPVFKKYIMEFKQKGCSVDRKSTRLNSSHLDLSRMPSSA